MEYKGEKINYNPGTEKATCFIGDDDQKVKIYYHYSPPVFDSVLISNMIYYDALEDFLILNEQNQDITNIIPKTEYDRLYELSIQSEREISTEK